MNLIPGKWYDMDHKGKTRVVKLMAITGETASVSFTGKPAPLREFPVGLLKEPDFRVLRRNVDLSDRPS